MTEEAMVAADIAEVIPSSPLTCVDFLVLARASVLVRQVGDILELQRAGDVECGKDDLSLYASMRISLTPGFCVLCAIWQAVAASGVLQVVATVVLRLLPTVAVNVSVLLALPLACSLACPASLPFQACGADQSS